MMSKYSARSLQTKICHLCPTKKKYLCMQCKKPVCNDCRKTMLKAKIFLRLLFFSNILLYCLFAIFRAKYTNKLSSQYFSIIFFLLLFFML